MALFPELITLTLHIYAVDGNLVRTLSLGHKAVGIYQTPHPRRILGWQKRTWRTRRKRSLFLHFNHRRFYRNAADVNSKVKSLGRTPAALL